MSQPIPVEAALPAPPLVRGRREKALPGRRAVRQMPPENRAKDKQLSWACLCDGSTLRRVASRRRVRPPFFSRVLYVCTPLGPAFPSVGQNQDKNAEMSAVRPVLGLGLASLGALSSGTQRLHALCNCSSRVRLCLSLIHI